MVILRNVLRIYSYIFEAILCLMAIAISAVTLMSGNVQLQVGWLPWTAPRLAWWLLSLGILGLICVLIAAAGKWRVPLIIFSLAVFVVLARGFFYSSYTFAGSGEFRRALLLLAGAFLAMIGALISIRPIGAGTRLRPRLRPIVR
ncbi:MAG: hypothetical protein M3Y07_03545 [Acidobacteriota bacterium]|nr:hypothetical protein [Acidobacteriota bacterium]